mgnify:FL=1
MATMNFTTKPLALAGANFGLGKQSDRKDFEWSWDASGSVGRLPSSLGDVAVKSSDVLWGSNLREFTQLICKR